MRSSRQKADMTGAADQTGAPRRALGGHGPRAARFAGVGFFNTGLDFLVFIVLHASGATALLANCAAFLFSNAASYALNARFTFGAADELTFGGYGRFLSVHLASLALSSAFIAVFAGLVGALGAKAVAAALALLWNYFASAHFVFRKDRGKP